MEQNVSAAVNAWLGLILGEKRNLASVKAVGDGVTHFLYASRNVCCLKYKLNKDRMCKSCSLRDPDTQQALYRAKYIK